MAAPSTVAVLCPHPDDEAIFCGGTIRALADRGHRVVIVAATSGDNDDGAPSAALRRAATLAGIATRYEMTVDREHLHFVDVHVVHTATEAVTETWRGDRSRYGHATVEIDLLAAVYGLEWFNRVGPLGPLDELARGAPAR